MGPTSNKFKEVAMATWKDVISNPEFSKETPEAQRAIRDDFFERVIAPQVQNDGGDVETIRQDFYSRSGVEASTPTVQGQNPTRTGIHAAQPGEMFYEADADGMPQVPVVGSKPLTSTVYPEGAPQAPSAPISAQEAPQAISPADGTIDTSYKPITIGERLGAWWNDEELRDPGVNPYPGMSPAQILAHEKGTDVADVMPQGTSQFETVAGGPSREQIIQEKADAFMAKHPDASPRRAMAEAKLEYNQELITTGAMIATLPYSGSLTALSMLAGATAIGGRGTAEVIDAYSDEGTGRSVGDRIIDTGVAGATDAGITMVGGKAINIIADGVQGVVRYAKGIAPNRVKSLNEAGVETNSTQEEYFTKSDELRTKVSDEASEFEVLHDNAASGLDEMVDAGMLTRAEADARLEELVPTKKWREAYQEQLDRRVVAKEITPQEARVMMDGSKLSDWEAAMFNKGNDELYNATMGKELTSMRGSTAADIIAARRKADVMGDTPGLKSGVKSVSDQIDNPIIKRELLDAALAREVDAASFAGIPIGQTGQELLGIRDPNLYRARKGGVKEATDNLNKQIDSLFSDGSNIPTPEAFKIKKNLRDANAATAVNDVDASKKAIKEVNSTLRNKKFNLTNKEESVLDTLKANIQTLNKINTKAGKLDGSNFISDIITSPALRVGLGSGAVSGFTGGEEGTGFNWQTALLGTAVGAAARKGMGKISQVQIDNRLGQVRKALGGKYKIDEEARQLIEDGHDVAKVIAYVVMKTDVAGGEQM